jgi:hypothetical protein
VIKSTSRRKENDEHELLLLKTLGFLLCDIMLFDGIIQWGMLEQMLLVLEHYSLWHLFILAYIEIYVLRGNPFQTHSLEQSYHRTQPSKQEKYNTK